VKKGLRDKIVSGLILGSLVCSLGSFAFAAETSEVPPAPPANCSEIHPPKGDFIKKIEESLSKLVSDNTITTEQKEKIIAFFKAKEGKQPPKEHGDMLTDLMNAGNLSTEQAKIVDDALRPPTPPNGDKNGGPQPPSE
jgi:hypothetical protein